MRSFFIAVGFAATSLIATSAMASDKPVQRYVGKSFCVIAPELSGKIVSNYKADYLVHKVIIGAKKVSIYEGSGPGRFSPVKTYKASNGWSWMYIKEGSDISLVHLTGLDFPGQIELEHFSGEPQELINFFHAKSERECD